MVRHRALRTNAFAALMLVGAACVAALLAHVAIDLAGDVLLAHDTYDGVDHRSRGEIFALSLVLAVTALGRFVWRAFDDARTGRRAALPRADEVVGRTPWRFMATAVVLTVAALMGMEFLDVTADGGRIDDVTDLFGGSAMLGLGITLPVAALAALAVRATASLVLQSRQVLVRVIGRFLALLLAERFRRGGKPLARVVRRRVIRRRSILSGRCAKRGPPVLAG